MAKPICLVSILVQYVSGMSPEEQMGGLQSALDVRFEDYHVLVLPSKYDQKDLVQMEVIYDKDFTISQFDEIKAIVIERLNELKKEKEAIGNEDKAKEKIEPIY